MALTSQFWQALGLADQLGEKQGAFAKAAHLSPAQLTRIKRGQVSPDPETQARIFAHFATIGVPIAKTDQTAAFFSPSADVQKLMTGAVRKMDDARVTKLAVEVVGRLAADPDMPEADRVDLVKKYFAGRFALGLDVVQLLK